MQITLKSLQRHLKLLYSSRVRCYFVETEVYHQSIVFNIIRLLLIDTRKTAVSFKKDFRVGLYLLSYELIYY